MCVLECFKRSCTTLLHPYCLHKFMYYNHIIWPISLHSLQTHNTITESDTPDDGVLIKLCVSIVISWRPSNIGMGIFCHLINLGLTLNWLLHMRELKKQIFDNKLFGLDIEWKNDFIYFWVDTKSLTKFS